MALMMDTSPPSRLSSRSLMGGNSDSGAEPDLYVALDRRPELIESGSDLRLDALQFTRGKGLSHVRRAAREHVKLDLRLRSRRPHRDSPAIREGEHQQLFFRNPVSFHLLDILRA